MKTKTLFPILLLLGCLASRAEEPKAPGPLPNDSSYNKKTPIPPPKREDTPLASGSMPMCSYGPGFLELALPRGVQYAKVRLFNSTQDWSGIVTVEQPRVEIPLFSGECRIICWTDDERQYSGKLFFPEIQ